MNSEYKWRDQISTNLNGSNTRNSCENGENGSTNNSFTRKHQRNLSLPVNNVFQVSNDVFMFINIFFMFNNLIKKQYV